MYDSLEGLDYKSGECSQYVSEVLKNIPLSRAVGDIVDKLRDDIEIGDVYIGGFSSHLIKDFHSFPPIRGNETTNMIIPKHVLLRKRQEHQIFEE